MRTRALLILTLALAFGAPAASTAQDKPAKKKVKKGSNTAAMEAFRKKQAAKMTGMGANARDSMDPTLKGLLTGPDSMVNITKRAEGMSDSEREAFAKTWRAKQAKSLGIGEERSGAPVMNLDELGASRSRAKLVLGSEQERRDMLLDELRVHARYSAKIERVTELAKASEGDNTALVTRAKSLRKLEAKRHARTKIRIRAAKVDPANATPKAAKAAPDETTPTKGGE